MRFLWSQIGYCSVKAVETGAWYIVMTDLQSGKRIIT